jgi:hypothetical protein
MQLLSWCCRKGGHEAGFGFPGFQGKLLLFMYALKKEEGVVVGGKK